jgi:phage gp16-like protein
MPPTNAEYAKINIACKQLGLDKYDLLADRYGLESSKQLNRQQTIDLLIHFKALGWKPKRKTSSKSSSKYDDPQMRKVVAIWITLAQAKVVRNGSDQALQKYVKRTTGKENLRWCGGADLYQLIESLKQWAAREDVDLA